MSFPRSRWTVVVLLALCAGALYFLLPDRRPNVLWITVDSLRPDRLSAYGYTSNATPNIDYLARNGVLFERAFTDSPWTTAALASSMTGRFAVHHSLRTPFTRLAEGETTIAEDLRARGYETAAIVGSFWLDRVYGLDRGFALYDDRYDSPIDSAGGRPHLASAFSEDVAEQRTYIWRKLRADSYRSDAAVGDAAVAWLRRRDQMRPFFLWVHFFGAHRRGHHWDDLATTIQRTLQEYDGHVSEADAQIGRILQQLDASGALARTIIILQGDHGEGLTQHSELEHGQGLYDSTLHIPLLISWPGHFAGVRVEQMVRSVDILPTLLAMLGMPQGTSTSLDGQSVEPLFHGGEMTAKPLLAETWRSAEGDIGMFNADGSVRIPGLWRRGVRTSRWKYILTEPHVFINFKGTLGQPEGAESYHKEELYDIEADPDETTDLADQHPDVLTKMRAAVNAIPTLEQRSQPIGG